MTASSGVLRREQRARRKGGRGRRDWSGTGYYGVANDDSICLSWDERDEGRLRCMDVLVKDGAVQKYNADGSLSGNIVEVEDGKTSGRPEPHSR